jgi:hypothetical protein
MAVPIAQLANGYIKYSDGSVKAPGSSATNSNYANYRPANQTPANQPYVPPVAKKTATPPGNQNPQPQQNPQPDVVPNNGGGVSIDDILRQQEERTRQAIMAKKQSAMEQASRELARAGQIKADTLTSIGDFRNRSNTAFQNADQQIVDTASGQYGENAQSFQSLVENLANQLRARNIGTSGQVSAKGRLMETLAKQQGATTAEKGRNSRENQLMLDERMNQASEQERTANTQYQGAADQASTIERMGVDQFGLDEAAAANAFTTNLNNLIQQQQQLALLKAQIPTSASQYNPTLNVADYMSKFSAPTGAVGAAPKTGAGSVVSDPEQILLMRKLGLLK